MSTNEKTSKTKIIVESAMLIAVAAVLSIFPKFTFLPNGGSITICSMLPIVLISYRRGLKWGFLAAFVFALIQTMTNFIGVAIIDIISAFWVIMLDYFIAYTVLGIGGIFKGKLKNPAKELAFGSLLAIGLRFVSHFISGVVLYGAWAEWFFGEMGSFGQTIIESVSGLPLFMVYSFIYNGSYLIPEMIITFIVSLMLGKVVVFGLENNKEIKA